MTRVVLVTGLGGAGRTTVAAATAVAEARAGRRTLLLAADGTADADTVLGLPLGLDPAEVEPGLYAARVAVREEFEREFLLVQEQLGGILALFGVDPLDPEEIAAVPGATDALALRVLARHVRAADDAAAFDLVVVDMPPAEQAVLALALPETLARYLDRLLPVERQAARGLAPILAVAAGVPMPDEWVYATARRVIAELDAVRAVLDGPGTSVRFVTRPGRVAAAADRRAASALALYGRPVGDVVVNGLAEGGTLAHDRAAALRALFPDAETAAVAVGEDEPLGADALAGFAETLPRLVDPSAAAGDAVGDRGGSVSAGAEREGAAEPEAGFEVEADGDRLVLLVPLPGAERGELDLLRRGDELIVTVGAYRRMLPLPSALRRCTIEGAGLRGGVLRVRFVPDPAVWMRR
ncbi:ArsA family ATPase [Yinghuangia sp. YIM S09857]|uniref:ArsA family ATPase n=1 Tax=Yinghuangia sp. YIM S09857 TaxID=3436929 RepID=UPI003F52E8BF